MYKMTELADSVVIITKRHTVTVVADGVKLGTMERSQSPGMGWKLDMAAPVPVSPIYTRTIPEGVEKAIRVANQLCAKGAFEAR